jgi:hypothetical protein
MATVHFAAVTAALLAGWMAARAEGWCFQIELTRPPFSLMRVHPDKPGRGVETESRSFIQWSYSLVRQISKRDVRNKR